MQFYLNFIYLLYMNQFPLLCGWHTSCQMSESRRSVQLIDRKKEIFPFMPLSSGLGYMHSPLKIPAIHSFDAPFSLLAWHPKLFSSSRRSRYQSTASAAYPLSEYQHAPLHRPSWQFCHSLHMVESSEDTFFLSTPFFTPHNCLILAFGT